MESTPAGNLGLLKLIWGHEDQSHGEMSEYKYQCNMKLTVTHQKQFWICKWEQVFRFLSLKYGRFKLFVSKSFNDNHVTKGNCDEFAI